MKCEVTIRMGSDRLFCGRVEAVSTMEALRGVMELPDVAYRLGRFLSAPITVHVMRVDVSRDERKEGAA